ncbi:MAG: maleylacetate reductase [Candidatus Binatus sp.]|uniref:maleylacetate reductase n=1 Tax=Candidatus Binatus sp. TaxID=2811406 RepID=UPI002720D7EC|nr:maleylacetate reductase [Candidatus Binatus sp.]
MPKFLYEALPCRVIFGVGSLERLPEEVERIHARRALVLSTPEQSGEARSIAERLGEKSTGVFAKAAMHVPIETAESARDEAKRLGADCCVAVGGGSTTGLAKAIALVSELPIIAIPTTYAGSEMTPIWGLTQGGIKKTGRDLRVLPRTVIYDPTLTLTMPPSLSGASGMNAIAHCVEALYAEDANPIISLMAEEGIRALAASLPVVVKAPRNLDARGAALYGAWLAGMSLGAVGMALHHKLCHTVGGAFNLPHAETHTAILPHAVAYNASAAPDAIGRVATAIGTSSAAQGLYDLAIAVGAKMALKDYGLKETDLDRAAELAIQNPYYNPRPVTREGIRRLLDDAYYGRRPTVTA